MKTFNPTREQIELIKTTICRGASDNELQLFMATAQRLGLDPFAKQIYAIFRFSKQEQRKVMCIQLSVDGYRLAADRTGCYAPGSPTEYHYDGSKLVWARAYVKKFASGTWHDIPETAYYDEFYNEDNSLWDSKPRVMLSKCAEVRALKRAFPIELGNVVEVVEEANDAIEEGRAALPMTTTELDVETAELTKALEAGDLSQAIHDRLNRIPGGRHHDELKVVYDRVVARKKAERK